MIIPKKIYIFDIDGTITNTTIFTPILFQLKKEKSFFFLYSIYAISPLIKFIDWCSRPLLQIIVFRFFEKMFNNYKYINELTDYYETKMILITSKVLNRICHKSEIYFITTNISLMNQFYYKKFNPKYIYSIDLTSSVSMKTLFNFKGACMNDIKSKEKKALFIGFGDSKYDYQFLNKCDKAYLIKNNKMLLL